MTIYDKIIVRSILVLATYVLACSASIVLMLLAIYAFKEYL